MTKLISNQSREEALEQFIEHGKMRICLGFDFCGYRYKDFSEFMAVEKEEVTTGILFQLSRAEFEEINGVPISDINPGVVGGMVRNLSELLDEFLLSKLPEIEKAFELKREENKAETMIAAAGF